MKTAGGRLPASLGLYGFLLLGVMLAGAHLGGWAQKIFLILLCLPLLPVGLTIISALFVRFNQEFSTDHPHKGEKVLWKASLSNPMRFWSCPIRILAYPIPGSLEDPGPGLVGPVEPGGRMEFSSVLSCPFRGVYALGIRKVQVVDPFFGFALRLTVQPRTFYVSPRTFPLRRSMKNLETSRLKLAGPASVALASESSNLTGLREYSPGHPLSRIHWKSLARYNKPFLVDYEGRSRRSALIILDSRSWDALEHGPIPDPWRIPCEDCAVEVFFSIIRAYVEDRTTYRFIAPGWQAQPEQGLEELLRRSTGIFFEQQTDIPGLLADPSIIRGATEIHFVSPILDRRSMDAAELLNRLGLPGGAWICVGAYPSDFAGLSELKRAQDIAGPKRNRKLCLIGPESEIEELVLI